MTLDWRHRIGENMEWVSEDESYTGGGGLAHFFHKGIMLFILLKSIGNNHGKQCTPPSRDYSAQGANRWPSPGTLDNRKSTLRIHIGEINEMPLFSVPPSGSRRDFGFLNCFGPFGVEDL
ncbi:hypothetical protein CEXT_426981 [Caerostris extrusa]|uniref:Uncharacterized protein n=1 Tax=Caerostris extrusa TaxID=172846 RepID=A0AAV4SGK9_CAEEX|nr:hypothetical protein CEXT_426981 [Caerostris extrusa]